MPKNLISRKVLIQVSFYFSLLLAWQLLSGTGIVSERLFPSPLSIAETLGKNSLRGDFWVAIRSSLFRILIGYSLAVLLGMILGFLLNVLKSLEMTLASLFLGLQAFPSICWVPVALLWFGVNDGAVIFVVVLGSVFSIAVATNQAIKNVPPLFIKAAKTMGAGNWDLYSDIVFPAAVPQILYGLKLGWSYAWRTLIGSEIIIATFGLGHLFYQGQKMNDINQIFAVNAMVLMISLIMDFGLFGKIERQVRSRWGLHPVKI